MSQLIPKRLLLGAVALGGVAALAACEEPSREPAPAPAPVVEPETPAAEDAAAPQQHKPPTRRRPRLSKPCHPTIVPQRRRCSLKAIRCFTDSIGADG